MAKVISHIVVRLPWWYGARIATLAALARAGFTIDVDQEAKAIVTASRLTLR